MLQQPHTAMSDWYAFTVMLMQCLLFVGPYGGVYRPQDINKNIQHEARPWQRLTVFHPEVRYPKPARPYTVVPDALLHYWHLVFEKDVRQPFPLSLLEALHWQTCPQCGTEHARQACPQCRAAVPAGARQVLTVRGTVTARQIFRTAGRIVYATRQSGKLRWLYHEDDRLCREDGTVVWHGAVDPQLHYRLCGDTTLLGTYGQAVTVKTGQEPTAWRVDSVAARPLFDTNATHQYWIDQGQLWRDGRLGPEYIGDVLAGQTHFWVGPRFGFGLYRAGTLSVALVFDAERRGLNDMVPLPPLRGQWLGATCVFTDTRCWFLVATQVQGKTKHQCFLIDLQGQIEASAEAEQDDGSWLGTLGGKSATGHLLFAPTDAGVVRVEAEHGQLVQTRVFPDTEPFVDSGCQLFAGAEGLYVVDHQDIRLLTMT
jgi:H/ACA ribonucleoprotein complex subunit 3